jgi:membrane-associated phospholipid phosphatase
VSNARPWKRAIAWIAFLGPFFFASYGFANWLASRRAHVGSIFFPWEQHIPFVPWTIIPYWSIDFLYVVSVFICTTERELDRHAQRLLFVQIVSIVFFIAFPLRFSFPRPIVDGLSGTLFRVLGSFDQPFNQAPSLHIGLMVVIWTRLHAHTAARWRWLLHAWMTLIGLSILTTYQHHFLDLPTGLLVGFLALWVFPDDAASPMTSMRLARDPRRLRVASHYAVGAIVFGLLASLGGTFLWLAWPAIALGVVAIGYAFIGASAFQKDASGRLTVGAKGLLAPYLAGAVLNSRLWTLRDAAPSEIADGVFLGRIPVRDAEFAAIVDLCAEISCSVAAGCTYHSIPVLDMTAPAVDELRAAADAIERARARGPVLVCCALGYSRSAAAVAAWLLTTGRASDADAAFDIIRRARPLVRLRDEHRAILKALA